MKLLYALTGAAALALWSLSAAAQTTTSSIVLDRENKQDAAIEPSPRTTPLDQHFSFGIDAGFTYRIAQAADNANTQQINKLRPGIKYGVDGVYYPAEIVGIGAKFTGRLYRASIDQTKITDHIFFFGPVCNLRVFGQRHRNAFRWGASIGYMHFTESQKKESTTARISKGGFGSNLDFGYDIRIGKKSFLSFTLGLSAGNIKVMIDGQQIKENTGAVDLTVGFRL